MTGPTPFGRVAIVWERSACGPRLVRVLLPSPRAPAELSVRRLFPEAEAGSSAEMDALARAIARLLAGDPVSLPEDVADLDRCPAFQRSVLETEARVPRGCVTTYRLLALALGRPGATRAVGRALASNPFPLLIPCHRAIRSDGHLGGFQGGLAMKRALLVAEGVRFDAAGHVCDAPIPGRSPHE
jgi:methylated-DNA-[protein]-cysteine S-methyltransferase